MPKKRSTIGRNPLDELGALKGRGRRRLAASTNPAATKGIRSMLSRRRAHVPRTLLARLGSALRSLNPFA